MLDKICRLKKWNNLIPWIFLFSLFSVENLYWISQQNTLLATSFFLLFYLKEMEGSRWAYLYMLLSVLSKSNFVLIFVLRILKTIFKSKLSSKYLAIGVSLFILLIVKNSYAYFLSDFFELSLKHFYCLERPCQYDIYENTQFSNHSLIGYLEVITTQFKVFFSNLFLNTGKILIPYPVSFNYRYRLSLWPLGFMTGIALFFFLRKKTYRHLFFDSFAIYLPISGAIFIPYFIYSSHSLRYLYPCFLIFLFILAHFNLSKKYFYLLFFFQLISSPYYHFLMFDKEKLLTHSLKFAPRSQLLQTQLLFDYKRDNKRDKFDLLLKQIKRDNPYIKKYQSATWDNIR